MEPSRFLPPESKRQESLVQVLSSKINVVQIPAAQPSYYVSDGSTASIYSLFQGKLWELSLTDDLLWRERGESGALHWDTDKFIDELIVSMKNGGMVFDEKPRFFFYYYLDDGQVDFEGEQYPLALSSTLPQKFALMLRLIQPEAPAAPEPPVEPRPRLFVPVRRKRKSKKQKVKEYTKIRKTKLRL